MADPVPDLPELAGEKRRTTCYVRALGSGINFNLKPGARGKQKRRESSKQLQRYGLEWTK